MIFLFPYRLTYDQGWRPRGTGGTVPPKFEVGGPPMHWSPQYFEKQLSHVRESMNRVKNCVFLVRKWSYTTFNIVNIRKMWEKKGKIRRTRSMTKKRSSEIFTLKMEIFPEIGPRKNFLVPPTSAPGLRPWTSVWSMTPPVHRRRLWGSPGAP